MSKQTDKISITGNDLSLKYVDTCIWIKPFYHNIMNEHMYLINTLIIKGFKFSV